MRIDCHGNRLGYGMGFYDKLLSKGYNRESRCKGRQDMRREQLESYDVRVDKICVL